jgi:phosphatidylserine/phosphatidylglycerophosphate/cardiolipin synthase-like enzyme
MDSLKADAFLRFFDARELMAVRPVCRYWRNVAENYLWTRFTSYSGGSSVIAPQDRKSGTLRDMIMAKIAEIQQHGGVARLAADQITDENFFRGLLGPILTVKVDLQSLIRVNVGSHAPRGGVGTLPGDAEQLEGPYTGGKAHAKFITGGDGVLLGSPNFTPTAMSGDTVESVGNVNNLQVKAYFNRYFDLMRGGSKDEDRQFARMLDAFNAANHPVSLALAPFVSIQPWLFAQLDGFDRLIIRMFLISELRWGASIIDGLNEMARKGVSIDAYIDEGQVYDVFSEYFDERQKKKVKNYYVWNACQALMRGTTNVRVFTQTGTKGIMHDKLILAEKDIKKKDGSVATAKRLIIGSSGFSTNVMNNKNWDIMMRADEDGLYDYMMRHHRATLESGRYNTKAVGKRN